MMERIESFDPLETEFLRECQKVPPDYNRLLSLLDKGVNINAENRNPYESSKSMLSDIILGYNDEIIYKLEFPVIA